MCKGKILIGMNDDYGFADRIYEVAYKLKLFKIDKYHILYDAENDKMASVIALIHGCWPVIPLLQKISERRCNGPVGHRIVNSKRAGWTEFTFDPE